jgi:ubiquinone/menaquinone biosynthesis C-methylase UbiE
LVPDAPSAGPTEDLAPAGLTPLERLQQSLSGPQFLEAGQRWLSYFKELCSLQPHERVLDVGCGRGRVTTALTRYLTEGSYEGFDVHQENVAWCTENITRRYPNFSFQAVDVFSAAHNPGGSITSDAFRFPYADRQFDFVFIVTVLNTLMPSWIENYLIESARVLKDGGRLLASFQLLNDDSLRLLSEKGKELSPVIDALNSGPDFGDYRMAHADTLEAGVALREEFALGLLERAGLQPRRPPYYGRWPGRETPIVVAHDFIVADRRP